MSTVTVQSAALSTGVRVEYVEQGDPDGTPVLLLHGYTDSWRSYEETLSYLPGSLRVVALTHRGHGDSQRPPDGYSIGTFAADAVALMDALGISAAVLVGHSMGCWIAEHIAIHHPERVLGVVLEGGFGPVRASEALAGLGAEVAALEDPIDREFILEFQTSTTARALAAGKLDTFVDESSKLPAATWKAVYESFAEIDYTSRLPQIDVPVLIAWGDQEAFVTASEPLYLAGRIPDSRVVVYEGGGHSLHWEECERFAAEIAAFVDAL